MPQGNRLPSVLIVDDDQVAANRLALLLSSNGFRASALYSAHDALIAADLEQPDGAILEVDLPDLDGVRLARRIQVLSPSIIILLMSSRLDATGTQACEFEVLAKMPPDKIIARLRQVIATDTEDASASTNRAAPAKSAA